MGFRRQPFSTIFAIALLITGCGPGSSGYSSASSDEPHEILCIEENTRISILEDQLEEARIQLEGLEQRKNHLQSAAEDLRSNVDRLASEN